MVCCNKNTTWMKIINVNYFILAVLKSFPTILPQFCIFRVINWITTSTRPMYEVKIQIVGFEKFKRLLNWINAWLISLVFRSCNKVFYQVLNNIISLDLFLHSFDVINRWFLGMSYLVSSSCNAKPISSSFRYIVAVSLKNYDCYWITK